MPFPSVIRPGNAVSSAREKSWQPWTDSLGERVAPWIRRDQARRSGATPLAESLELLDGLADRPQEDAVDSRLRVLREPLGAPLRRPSVRAGPNADHQPAARQQVDRGEALRQGDGSANDGERDRRGDGHLAVGPTRDSSSPRDERSRPSARRWRWGDQTTFPSPVASSVASSRRAWVRDCLE